MLTAAWRKNDKRAAIIIIVFSVVVFAAIFALSAYRLNVDLGFNPHWFAFANAILNSIVSVLLIAALIAVRNGKYKLHRNIMLTALFLSVLFLVSYICHHLFAGETRFGDVDHNGIVSEVERVTAGKARLVYFILLATHIPLAGLILPFILFTAYRALIGEWPRHRRLARITWPIWLYVSITGVLVYWMISPYYSWS